MIRPRPRFCRRSCRRPRPRGFSLIELLVVVSILVILIGILMPVLGSVRKQAKIAVCTTHVDQIVKAFGFYLTENNQVYPGGTYKTIEVQSMNLFGKTGSVNNIGWANDPLGAGQEVGGDTDRDQRILGTLEVGIADRHAKPLNIT